MKKRIHGTALPSVLAAAALLLVLIGMLVFNFAVTGKSTDSPKRVTMSEEDAAPIHFTGEKETLSGETIQSEIREMGDLVTAEYAYSHAEDFQNVKTLFGLQIDLTKTTLIYTVDGMIQAGIDFRSVQVEADQENRVLKVLLPRSRITSSEIDHDSFHLVSEQEGWFNNLSAEDVNRTFAHVKEMEEEKAVQNGLLDRADENAEKMITSFVKSAFDLKDYRLEVER